MTDNYNDDYREVIPEEEKTETNVSETQDNEKNNGNTQVADTAKENSTEKKSEDKKDSSEYEDVCFICRRPESKAGPMITMPGGMCLCHDCMQKAFDSVMKNGMDLSQIPNMPYMNLNFNDLSQMPPKAEIPKKTEA